MRNQPILLAAAVAMLAACTSSEPPRRRAIADLDPRSGSAVTGRVELVEKGSGVDATITVAGATPGRHGVHIHQIGDCSDEKAEAAGDHWNPTGAMHGGPRSSAHHAGDFGNVEVGADGRGTLTIHMPGLSVKPGKFSVVGHAVIVHGNVDDLASQPGGNAGPRIACGVIATRLK